MDEKAFSVLHVDFLTSYLPLLETDILPVLKIYATIAYFIRDPHEILRSFLHITSLWTLQSIYFNLIFL